MKKIVHAQKEIIHPIGFLEDGKKPSIFGKTREDPEKIFLMQNVKDSPIHFSSKTKKDVVITYSAVSRFTPSKIEHIVSAKVGRHEVLTFLYDTGKAKKLLIADHKRGHLWWVRGPLSSVTERGGIVSDFTCEGKHILYYGESLIWTATSKDLKVWTKYKEPVLRSRPGFFDHGDLKFIGSKICERGIIIFYDASVKAGEHIKLQIGAALVSCSDPKKVIWRSDIPLFEKKIVYEPGLHCVGCLFFDGMVSFYWYSEKGGIVSSSVFMPFSKPFIGKPSDKIKRSEKNPIIAPKPGLWWASAATLNPAAVNIDGTVHLLFRAMGHDGISRIGYAKSKDGIHVDEVYPEPVFALEYSKFGLRPVPEKKFDPVMYPSGGSWGGCEDQRMVRIGDRVYVTFNAFDNWDNIRVGMVSISLKDFLNKKWNWSEMKFISPVGRHKNWVLFPEKINDKYAILHNLHAEETDRVMVEYFNDMNALGVEDPRFKSPDPLRMPNRPIAWHLRMKAPGPAPIKTPEGWLLIYQAHDAEMGKYKIGVLLLDLNDPTKIIARSSVPILTPDMWYENDWKPGIVYMCGAVVKDGTLFMYYGGGDKYVCVATVPLSTLLDALKHDRMVVPIINKVIIS